MRRMIKRYDNRKLYDMSSKQYVSLSDIAQLVRDGDDVVITDNASGEDLTAQTLTKVILEENSESRTWPPPRLLHELVRSSGRAVAGGMEHLFRTSVDRMVRAREAGEKVHMLRRRLKEIEKQIADLEKAHGDNIERKHD